MSVLLMQLLYYSFTCLNLLGGMFKVSVLLLSFLYLGKESVGLLFGRIYNVTTILSLSLFFFWIKVPNHN